jgi:hypothetical protein
MLCIDAWYFLADRGFRGRDLSALLLSAARRFGTMRFFATLPSVNPKAG